MQGVYREQELEEYVSICLRGLGMEILEQTHVVFISLSGLRCGLIASVQLSSPKNKSNL